MPDAGEMEAKLRAFRIALRAFDAAKSALDAAADALSAAGDRTVERVAKETAP